MTNQEIKNLAKKNGVFLWELADSLEISVETLTRKFRHELTDADKKTMVNIINKISKVKKK